MTFSDWTTLALHMTGVALFVYPAVRFVVKPLARLWIRRDGKETEAEIEALKSAPRLAAVVFGSLFGLLPEVWPPWVPFVWTFACGAIAGSFCIVAHEAVQAALPEAIARFLTGKGLSSALRPGGGE